MFDMFGYSLILSNQIKTSEDTKHFIEIISKAVNNCRMEDNPTSTPAHINNLMKTPTSQPVTLEKMTETLILSCLSCSRYATHQDYMKDFIGDKESVNPDQVQLHGCKMDPNPINPILPPTPKPFDV